MPPFVLTLMNSLSYDLPNKSFTSEPKQYGAPKLSKNKRKVKLSPRLRRKARR